MNWANRLTVARFFLTLLFVATLSAPWPFAATVSLGIFIVASVTDYIDGEIARRYSLVTDFGKLMDPLVDKIMVAAAFICLVSRDAIPAWVAVVVISREFLITGLRLLAISKGRVLPAEALGKHKTAWQIVTIIFFLALLSWRELLPIVDGVDAVWHHVWNYGGTLLIACAVILTLFSGFGYIWKNRALIQAQ